MNKQNEQYMTSFGDFTDGQLGRQRRMLRGFIRATAVLLLCLVLPATALAAVDLQVAELSDTGYDPSPVGTVVHYHVGVVNGSSTKADATVTLFDLPEGTALSVADAPSFCSAVPGLNGTTRVTCINPSSMNAADAAHEFTLPVITLKRPVGDMTVRAAIGYAADAPAASTPLSSLANGHAFFGDDTNQGNNVVTQQTTLTESTDLVLTKAATPDPVVGGGEITYILTVTNEGPSVASGFVVTDSLDANTSMVPGSASGAGWAFNGANGTYNGTLAVGDKASYSFSAKANVGSGTVTNGASVAAGAGKYPDNNPNNNNATVTTNVTQGADLILTKVAAPVPAIAGEPITFTLTARNLGPSAASNVSVVDPLPSGFSLVSVTPSTGTCVNGTTVSCNLGNLAKGDHQTITIVATVPLSASGQFTNTASISSDTPDPFDKGSDNQGSATFDVLADGADVSITKSKTKARVPVWKPGQPLADSVWTSVIAVRNDGPRAVTDRLQVVETLALGEKWVDVSGNDLLPGSTVTLGNWECSVNASYAAGTRQVVTCNMVNGYPLDRNGQVTLTLNTLPLVVGELRNEVCTAGGGSSIAPLTAGGANRDPNLINNCTGAGAVATNGYVDLKISKRTNAAGDGDNIVAIGDGYVDFTIVVSSSADSVPTAGVVINDTLPGYAGGPLTVRSQSNPNWSCLPTGGSMRCDSGNTLLQPGAGNAFTVTFRAPRPLHDSLKEPASACTGGEAGRFCNTAGVGINLNHPDAVGTTNTADDSASDWFAVYPVANVSTTSKEITSGGQGTAGVETTYVIGYLNHGPSDVTGVVFRDEFTLPANDSGFVLLSAVSSKAGSTCTVSSTDAAVVGTAASGGMSYANNSASTATLTITCTPVDLADEESRNLTVKIRPNVNIGNTGRTFTNVADFFLDRNGDGVADSATGVDANGIPFNHNSDTTDLDDKRSASLQFGAGKVDLLINKEDRGFTGGIDPLGFDSRPGQSANNVLKYRVSVRNQGPSLATGANIEDTIVAPPGASIRLLGSQLGNAAGPSGPVVAIGDAGALCRVLSGGNPTALGGELQVACDLPSAGTGMVGNGQIAVNQTSYLYLVYEYLTAPPAYGATILNKASTKSNETETNTANNATEQSTSIRTRSDLKVVKLMTTSLPSSSPSVAIVADTEAMLFQPIWYVLDITNLGPGHSRSVDRTGNSPLNGTGTVVTDVLAAGLELITNEQVTWSKIDSPTPTGDSDLVAGGNGSCSSADVAGVKTLTCQLGDLALEGKARVLIPARWVTLPAGGKGSNKVSLKTEQVDPTPGNDDSTVTNDIKVSSLAGRVFEDSERSGGDGGIHQSTETGLSGVTVTLSGSDQWGNPVSKTTTTNTDGTYRFGDLAPSDSAGYVITQTQPTSHNNGPVNPPTAGASAPSEGGVYNRGVSRGDSSYIAIVLAGDTNGVRYDFPEVRRPSLSGVVYVDTDFSDSYGTANDAPIAGAVVELLNAADGSLIATTGPAGTDAGGNYRFNDLDPEITYTLREVLPAGGYKNRPTAINPGTIGGKPCAAGSCVVGTGVGGDAASTDRISSIDLSSGADGIKFNFGEDAVTSISGTVYLDSDDNGAFDSPGTDGGIPGVVVILKNDKGVEIARINTDANGNYSFDGQVVGKNYSVEEVQPAGYAQGKQNGSDVIAINNLPLAGSLGNNFGEKAASLSGVVYLDSNNNGVQDAGEPGLSGVQVTLSAATVTKDALGKALGTVATTDGAGKYRFANLLADTYAVTEQVAQPVYNGVATHNGKTTAGSIDSTVVGTVTEAPSKIANIALPAGKDSLLNNFGEILVATISGTVYVDRNDNGGFDAGDAGTENSASNGGIAGVEIVLYAADGVTKIDSTTTDALGNYAFANKPSGVGYVIKESQPAGYAPGKEQPGNEITILALSPSGSSSNNYGEKLGSLGGYVYEDFSGTASNNNNGAKDAGEKAIAGVTLTLSGTDSAGKAIAPRTVTTNAAGVYSFGDLLQGTYTITETQPSAYIDGKHTAGNATVAGSIADANIISGVGLDAGQNATGYLFGELANAPISGTIYIDRNNDGKQDAGESGIPNISLTVEVEVTPGNWVPVPGPAIVTDNNGHYTYPEAVTGKNYRVTETQPGDLGDGKENGTVNTGKPNVIIINNLPSTGSSGNNFGEIAAVLSGAVYLDSNNDGIKDAGEPGLPNVEVTLPAGTKDALGKLIAKVVTDADGNYVFQDLLAGTYTVTQQLAQPLYGGATTHNGKTTQGSTGGTASLVTETPSAIKGIALLPGESSVDNNFGEVLVAGISGTVYVDRDDSGSFDAGDAGNNNSAPNGGIEGVVVVLYAADGTTEITRRKTDAQGAYAFGDLPTGVDYVVKELQPDGYAEGKQNPGNEISIGKLPLAGVSNQNFGEKLGGLNGVVYEDFSATGAGNNNGSQDSGEAGIAGVTLTLSGTDAAGKPVNRTTTTDNNGGYSFGDLLAGNYTITETQPAGYEDGKHTVGNATTVGSNTVANILSGIGLDAGQQASGYLFGELKKAPISGTVYVDRNDNGGQDPGEPGIPGVSITITSNGPDGVPGGGDDVNVTITTGSDGSYSWPDALPGVDYSITQTQPADLADGKENTSNVITINNLPSTGSDNNNFGEKAAVLSGAVYLDSNNNGTQDAAEPGLANVEVELPASVKNVLGQAALKATTDANGNYVFQDLLAGTYVVTQQTAQPTYNGAPTINGITTVGTTGGAATLVTTVPSAISGINLAAGGVSEKNNFGEVLQVSISGAVFLDVNNDGAMLGAAETGLDGVVIELSGIDDTGATVNLSTTTDKDGKFSFEGLRPGKYSLTEPTQPTGTANGITTAGSAGGTATPVTTVPSKITDIDLSVPGSASVDNLFGEIPRSSAISGKVWEDTNNDGVVDPGEKGIGGVTVELEGTAIDGTSIKLTVTTDADGNYSFDELPPGTYTVTEPNQPPGTLDGKTVPGSTGGTATPPGTAPSKISTIVVGVNETSKDNNFGEVPVGSIAGFVYNDSNDDGIKQNDEGGYAMIDVVLTGTDDLGNPVNVQGVTDAQGHYVFQNLRPGTYIVTEPTQPAETLNGLTTAGSIDGVKSGAKVTGKETVPSQIDGIVLKPGNNSVDNNFGEIGDSPDMLVSKASNTVKFTVNNVATYTIRVRNGGQKPSFGEYIVKDRLPVGLTLAEVPAGNNWTCSGAVGDARFECRSSEVVNVGTTSLSDITVKVHVGIEAANAGTVNNAVLIEGGGENEFRTPTTTERNTFEGNVGDLPVCDAAITQNACRVPNQVQLSSSVGGTVWFDVGSDDTFLDGGDQRLQSWIVELLDSVTGLVSQSTITAVDGSYRFGDVIPGVKWNIQFRDPSSGVLWAWPVNQETVGGMGVACDSPQAIGNDGVSACRVSENGTSQLQVVLEAGQHLPQQSLPVDPSGVVYDAVTRDPVPGSIVTIAPIGVCTGYDPKTAILNAGAGGYRVEGNAVSMTVGNNGYYQFMFGPAAPARCEFQLTVTPPGGYQFVSSLIPAETGSLSPLGAAGSSHLVQPQTGAPTGAVGTPTQYWLNLFAGSATAGIVHNHIPLDTAEATGLVITKTGDRQTAEIGDTVQYTITVRQTAGSAMATLNVVDTLPRGFTYIDGTGRVGGRAVEDPIGKPGPRLGFNLGPINVGQQLVLTYRVRVGVGAQQGDGINRAQAHGCSITGGCIDPVGLTPVPGSVPSNRAEYRVRVTGGVFTEEACVLGKIFVDCNNNHVQDKEELGIPGVRMYFSNGTWMISDSEGKYSYCGLTPQSHTLKVDPSTLPVGARLTTSSNRNLGDADSLFLDLKNGELHRADFVEGSCSNPLLEQVKARRTQGEVRAPETETGQSQLRFDSKPVRAPQQATDSSNQGPIVQPRPNPPSAAAQQEVQP